MELEIINMYPDILNLYGDIGNLIAIKQRCRWRNIKVNIHNFTVDNEISIENGDIILIGGGADSGQNIVSKNLQKQRNKLSQHIESEKPILAICGSYQMFGDKYIDANKNEIPCLELFDMETINENNRLIGNILINTSLNIAEKRIIGFENHGGRTYHKYKPFGEVVLGNGNNGKDKTEGMIYKNFIGSYLHGPLLPKNPTFTDYIIFNALNVKYGIESLENINIGLNDSIEENAQIAIGKKLFKKKF
ncbi:MAG: glutamine amidotransferase [Methanobrevibacter sp.]|jgi:CobQ-like glutamine amidotransferase family enzyme|nr:glutamine amidotransferase [Candidatus Methanoflexus mossambicus]